MNLVGNQQQTNIDSNQEHTYMNNGDEPLIMNFVLSHENATAF